jgi:hypothetical protein
MSKSVGESLPEPEPEPGEKYFNQMFWAYDRYNSFPVYTNYVNDTNEFEVRSFDDGANIAIEASVYGKLAENYTSLGVDEQYDLARRIKEAMAATASRLPLIEDTQDNKREAVVLINNLPVIFEPINNALLVGVWADWERRKMNIRSEFIQDHNQQRLLLGGLAAFVTYLEQR